MFGACSDLVYPLNEDIGDMGGVFTGDAVAGSEVTAMKEVKVEYGK